MERKNVSKKSAGSRSRNTLTPATEKRYSKTKMRHDAMTLSDKRAEDGNNNYSKKLSSLINKVDKAIVDIKAEQKKKRQEYVEKYNMLCAEVKAGRASRDKIVSQTNKILTASTEQRKGYSVIPKGQCVLVTEYECGIIAEVRTMDGRVGITPVCNLKPMSFAKV